MLYSSHYSAVAWELSANIPVDICKSLPLRAPPVSAARCSPHGPREGWRRLHSEPRALERSTGSERKRHSMPGQGKAKVVHALPWPSGCCILAKFLEKTRGVPAWTLLPVYPVVCSIPVAAGSWHGRPNSADSLGSSQFLKRTFPPSLTPSTDKSFPSIISYGKRSAGQERTQQRAALFCQDSHCSSAKQNPSIGTKKRTCAMEMTEPWSTPCRALLERCRWGMS